MRKAAYLFLLGLALLLMGCPPAEQAPLPAPENSRTVRLTEPFLEATFPATWKVSLAAPGQPEALLSASDSQGAQVMVLARRLQQTLDLERMGQALARVDQGRLKDEKGAQDFSPSQAEGLGGVAAVSYSYALAGQAHRRWLAVAGLWLYTVDMAGAAQPQAAWQAVLAAIRLVPGAVAPALAAAPGPASAGGSGPGLAGLRALLDSLDPVRLAQARAQLAQARQAYPQDQRLAALEAEATALHLLALRMTQRPDPRLDLTALRGRAQAAAQALKDDAAAQRAWGLLLLAQRQGGDAEAVLERALALGPRDGRNLLAQAFWRAFDPAAQERLARQALALNPGLPAARMVLARALLKQGRPAEAAELFRQVLAADGDHAQALAGLASVEMDEPASQGQARTRFQKALQMDPQDTAALFNLALLLKRQGQAGEAEQELSRLLALDPGDAAAHNLRGQVLQEQKRYAQARESYLAATKADPRHAQAFFNLGALCASQLGDPACARGAFIRFLELEPSGPRTAKVREWLARQGQ